MENVDGGLVGIKYKICRRSKLKENLLKSQDKIPNFNFYFKDFISILIVI